MNSFSSLDTKSKNDNVFIKILIPSNSAGAVIGKGGQALVKAQDDTGATVKISKVGEYYPETTERVCIVYGDRSCISAMIDYISSCISDKTELKGFGRLDRQKQTILVIPNSSAGLLIGREGETISNVKKDSGAFIQVSPKMINQSGGERCVTITGNTEQRSEASKMIIDKIIEDPKLCSFPNLVYNDSSSSFTGYSKIGSPSYESNFDNSPYHYTGNGSGGVGGSPGQRNPHTNNPGHYHYNKIGSGSGQPSSSMGPGPIGSPHSPIGNKQQPPPHMLSRQQQHHHSHPHPSQFILPSTTSPPSVIMNNPSSTNSPPHTFHQMDYIASSSVNGIVRNLDVDQEYVGAIIGPKGASIIELQEITNTTIKISKKPDQLQRQKSEENSPIIIDSDNTAATGGPPTGKRTVTIYGFYQDVSRAYLLISDKVKNEQIRRQKELPQSSIGGDSNNGGDGNGSGGVPSQSY